ncbi:MAG: hypothetical protein S4CHLAM123_15060 [Chlamydiales bacterium]|nr:hypothetical protein [Chlamydiales bacterium]
MGKIVCLLFACCLFVNMYADSVESIKEGPIHEAFLVQEFGDLILEAVPNQPPKPITELKPLEEEMQAIWIPGYWAWSRKYGEYMWVSGVWRRPPPGLYWISGYWKGYPVGWVWIHGFWSRVPEEALEYIAEVPPDSLDEKIQKPEAPVDQYFWAPGYWAYDSVSKQYVWYLGRFEVFSEKWVYSPAHYIWREKGYAFVPDFWDWPLEERGIAYASAHIDPDFISLAVYEPTEKLEPLFIVEQFYPYWPSFSCFYAHHYHFHRDLWVAWGGVPPWWNWVTWWGHTSPDQWWVWWWWTHPGYPNPHWMDSAIAQKISPPSELVLKRMKKVRVLPNITSSGVIGNAHLVHYLEKITGRENPILSSDPKQLEQLQEVAKPLHPNAAVLTPEGKTKNTEETMKPFFGPSKEELKVHPERLTLPPKPTLDSIPHSRKNLLYNPSQEFETNFEDPRSPKQMQHLDDMMTESQPLRNPIEPKVYQTPGNESTIPNYKDEKY